jgi:2,5-diketo-D-gluconate reductase A
MAFTATSAVPTLALNDGHVIPVLGIGVWQVPDDQAFAAVQTAIEAGCRSIDTAAAYQNERAVGRAVRESAVPRAELFVTTKLWNDDQGYDTTLRAFDASMERLGLDYLDLYLIHWQAAGQGRYIDTFKAFQRLKADGRVGSIGVSNFTAPNLDKLIDACGETPAINQIELHPRLAQAELREFHADRGIVTEAWSPLGSGLVLDDPTIGAIAEELDRSIAQVILRWHIQLGNVVIPKSVTPDRIRSNLAVFDFQLTPEQMALIGALDDGTRTGPDPDMFGN